MKKIKKVNGVAGVVSLVTGILGMLTFPLVFSTTAIISGAIGLSKNQKFSVAGLVLGIIGWVFGFVAFLVAWFSLIALLG